VFLTGWDDDIYKRWLEVLMGLPRAGVLQGKLQYARWSFPYCV
jgi:hypothetical protein